MTDKSILERAGANIRAERERQGLNQTELADLVSSNKMKISQVENGKHNSGITFFVNICKALKVNWVDQLIDY